MEGYTSEAALSVLSTQIVPRVSTFFRDGDTMLAKVEFTTRCNLDCIHCCASIFRPAPDWKTDQLMNVFEQLIAEGYNQFELKGGEPFIRSDIFDIMDLLEHNGAEFYLTSNSLLLNEDKIQKLLSYKNLSTFSISLDGATKETHESMRGANTFEHTVEMIQLCTQYKKKLNSQTRLGLNFTITRLNHHEIGEIFTLTDRLGLNSVFILSLSLLGNAVKNKDKLFLSEKEEFLTLEKGANILRKINIARQVKGLHPLEFDMELFPYTWKCRLMQWSRTFRSYITEHKCGSGIGEIYVDSNGTIYPCEGVRVFLDMLEKKLGPYERPTIHGCTVKEAKQKESFKKIVNFLQDYDSIFKPLTPCGTCPHLGKCTVCPLFAIKDGGMKRCTPEVLT